MSDVIVVLVVWLGLTVTFLVAMAQIHQYALDHHVKSEVITALVVWLGGWAIITTLFIWGGMVIVVVIWFFVQLIGSALLYWTAHRPARRAEGQV